MSTKKKKKAEKQFFPTSTSAANSTKRSAAPPRVDGRQKRRDLPRNTAQGPFLRPPKKNAIRQRRPARKPPRPPQQPTPGVYPRTRRPQSKIRLHSDSASERDFDAENDDDVTMPPKPQTPPQDKQPETEKRPRPMSNAPAGLEQILKTSRTNEPMDCTDNAITAPIGTTRGQEQVKAWTASSSPQPAQWRRKTLKDPTSTHNSQPSGNFWKHTTLHTLSDTCSAKKQDGCEWPTTPTC